MIELFDMRVTVFGLKNRHLHFIWERNQQDHVSPSCMCDLPTIVRSLYVGLDPSSEGCSRHADTVDISVFEACRLVV